MRFALYFKEFHLKLRIPTFLKTSIIPYWTLIGSVIRVLYPLCSYQYLVFSDRLTPLQTDRQNVCAIFPLFYPTHFH